jgi:hypothetical protein
MTDVKPKTDLIQAAVDELLSRGRQRGFVTWEEMNSLLPDDAVDHTNSSGSCALEEENITLDESTPTATTWPRPTVPREVAIELRRRVEAVT